MYRHDAPNQDDNEKKRYPVDGDEEATTTDLDAYAQAVDSAATNRLDSMHFPAATVGRDSPTVLTVRTIASATFTFGAYLFVLRLFGMAFPNVILLAVKVVASIFAIALAMRLCASERRIVEWPLWVGGSLLAIVSAQQFFPNLSFWDSSQPGSTALFPPLLLVALGALLLVSYLSSPVRKVVAAFSKGQLILGLIATVLGGWFSVACYAPESSFGAWNLFVLLLFFAYAGVAIVADQYKRFQEAMAPNGKPIDSEDAVLAFLKKCGLQCCPWGIVRLGIALWLGNYVFLATLNKEHACEIGLQAFAACLGVFTILAVTFRTVNPWLASWDALCFWLTYNRQRLANPLLYQCSGPFREPLVRIGVVGAASAFLGLGLLHLSGIHASRGSNRLTGAEVVPVIWNRMLPQCYPALFQKDTLPKEAKDVYDHCSVQLVNEGEADMPFQRRPRTLGEFVYSACLFFFGGPLLFVLMLVATQGNYLASIVEKQSGKS